MEAQAILPLLAAERWGEALTKCLEAYQEAIYRYVVSMLDARGVSAPESLAPDIVHDTFLTAWTRFATFAGRSTVRVWLFGIAIHTLRNSQAKLTRRIHLEKENFKTIFENAGLTWLLEEIPRTPALASRWWEELHQRNQAMSWQERLDLVHPALKQLRRRSTFYHFLLEQHVFEGRSFAKIATTAGMSARQVKKEFVKAQAMFISLFAALLSDAR